MRSATDLAAWPSELRGLQRYLPWRARPRHNGRTGKVPQGLRGARLYPHNPLDAVAWLSFDRALAQVQAGAAHGLGLVLTRELGWVGLDLDHCRAEGGGLTPPAQDIVRRFPDAYVEWSPSGGGVHVLVPGRCPAGLRPPRGVDVIDHGFLTVTGNMWRPGGDMRDTTEDLARWFSEVQRQRASPPRTSLSRAAQDGPSGDGMLIDRAHRARNGHRFGALWAGELCGYPSASEADLALVLLLYWTGDPADDTRIDRLFRQSARYRPRWDLPQHRPYGQRTIAQARLIRAGR